MKECLSDWNICMTEYKLGKLQIWMEMNDKSYFAHKVYTFAHYRPFVISVFFHVLLSKSNLHSTNFTTLLTEDTVPEYQKGKLFISRQHIWEQHHQIRQVSNSPEICFQTKEAKISNLPHLNLYICIEHTLKIKAGDYKLLARFGLNN